MAVQVRQKEELTDRIAIGRRSWEARYGAAAGPAMEAISNIIRVREIVVNFMEDYLAELELNFLEYDVLSVIAEADMGGLPLSQIRRGARKYFGHQTSITNVVTRLGEYGLVTIKPDSKDRRVTRVALSRSGTNRLRKANEMLADVDFGLGALTRAELESVSALLFKVRAEHGDATP
jgi:DNA-binding MarR family transcriptional regulator